MRLDLNCSQHKNNDKLCDMIELSANATMIIILQYINVPTNQYCTPQTYITLYVGYISIFKKR